MDADMDDVETSSHTSDESDLTDIEQKCEVLKADEAAKRLGKRLCFFLRYGAEQAGLEVREGGWVSVSRLLTEVSSMRFFTEEDLDQEVATSVSYRGSKRFETREDRGERWIRALYGRRMERSATHSGSKVKRLLQISTEYVTSHLDDYDLEGFPDHYLLQQLIHHLKRNKRLNTSALRTLLIPTLETLDMEHVYLTETTLKIIGRQCPDLKSLSLRGAGYVLTDHSLACILKNLPKLDYLNISDATHLTDQSLKTIAKRLPGIRFLDISEIRSLSERAIIEIIQRCKELEHLDIFTLPVSPEGRKTIARLAKPQKERPKGTRVVLKGFSVARFPPLDPSGRLKMCVDR